jgi:hypothetical protein
MTGNQPIIITLTINGVDYERDIITDSLSINYVYHNNLDPADATVSCKIPFDLEVAELIKVHNNTDIKVVFTNGTKKLFTGFLRKNFNFEKKQRVQPIALEIVSPSYLLKKKIAVPFQLENVRVYDLIVDLVLKSGFTFDVSLPGTISDYTVPFFQAEEKDDIHDIISELLFEFGYVLSFNTDGALTANPLFNQPPNEITQVFDGSNIRSSLTQTAKEEKYTSVVDSWENKELKLSTLVFQDTTGNTAIHQARIEIAPNAYYLNNEWNYLDLDSTLGEVVYAKNFNYNETVFEPGIYFNHKVEYGKPAVRFYNNTTTPKYITKFEVYADAYINTGVNKTGNVVGDSDNVLEIESKYVLDETIIKDLVQNVADYYRYSDFTVKLHSNADYPIGSFVTVKEAYMGTIVGRIIDKKIKLLSDIEYGIEAIKEYQPAEEAATYKYVKPNFSWNIISYEDTVPPTRPIILRSSVDTSHGYISITFSESVDEDSGVAYYRVYRKLQSENVAKVPYTISPPPIDEPYSDDGTITFTDDRIEQYENYIYQISAIDRAGNESLKSNELRISSTINERPLPPLSVYAIADNADYIVVSVTRRPDLTDDRHIAVAWLTEISRDGGTMWDTLPETSSDNFTYYYDRNKDGYPEKSDLANYLFRVYSKSRYNQYSERGTVSMPPDTTFYLGWQPVLPDLKIRASGRQVGLSWAAQYIYGKPTFEVQIAKQLEIDDQNIITDLTNDSNWRVPSKDDTNIFNFGQRFQSILDSCKASYEGYRYHYGDFKEAYSDPNSPGLKITNNNAFNMSVPLDQVVRASTSENEAIDGGVAGTELFDEAIDGGNVAGSFDENIDGGIASTTQWEKSEFATLYTFGVDTVYYFRVKCTEELSGKTTDWVRADCLSTSTGAMDVVNDAIRAAQIEAGAIINEKLGNNAVTEIKIAPLSITETKIGDDSISTRTIQAEAVTSNEIASRTILAENIKANEITGNEIAANTIAAGKLVVGTVTSDSGALGAGGIKTVSIANGAVVASKIYVEELSAITANMGLLTDGALQYNSNNYWAMSNNTAGITPGTFQIGNGNDHVLKFVPGEGLTIKTTVIEITSLGTKVKGGLKVEDSNDTDTLFEVVAANDETNDKINLNVPTSATSISATGAISAYSGSFTDSLSANTISASDSISATNSISAYNGDFTYDASAEYGLFDYVQASKAITTNRLDCNGQLNANSYAYFYDHTTFNAGVSFGDYVRFYNAVYPRVNPVAGLFIFAVPDGESSVTFTPPQGWYTMGTYNVTYGSITSTTITGIHSLSGPASGTSPSIIISYVTCGLYYLKY